MIILGFESSCDDTGVSIFCSNRGVVINLVNNQSLIHKDYGGVVPELASRDHLNKISFLTNKAFEKSGLSFSDIDAVAYTIGPGLSGSLLIGSSFAQTAAWSMNIPAIPIHHLEGHLLSPLISNAKLEFPFISLLVSGGHTQLMAVNKIGDYNVIGETLDDAAGEAFDKIARLMGLDYCNGAEIAKLAVNGDPDVFQIPRPMFNSPSLDFSFSGLKTAAMIRIKELQSKEMFDHIARANIAASVQKSIIDILIHKSYLAVKRTGIKTIVVAGGVSANNLLRVTMLDSLKSLSCKVYFPPLELSTDNAAMISFAAYLRLKHNLINMNSLKYNLSVKPRWNLKDVNSIY
ncbi:tRNA (adenosine(37)-N6)-threonylcarbamoyltransferase complex transferase subunit TsaD [Candidatus Kinetoplastidibacterium crithidiae]|uniref:tRNA N6-adenosine threonylcarbamoyltransferase n=1 Tax=Candidatus Kinetoplastidibacterium crithidiae TCC036E TaxID=1208918 RepID=M1L497_9PROT|nr:tRNA (adenosine(37)-N6)-threonylcarbamoyltransferase complex transferase subunit TsaD [Candidatus Kinetoplastibacterium crithidii]AFZ82794.1 O-sialoglycoprotein endopeptidase [Candidatus Kinetoplastibacterium crithidii (ex Angomonas deanei ATCC 30255)]AGF47553.1 O-sialoglycoprotein endopeptidase [Candidatus Kinetoplastibacterium crithidii TCC036E]